MVGGTGCDNGFESKYARSKMGVGAHRSQEKLLVEHQTLRAENVRKQMHDTKHKLPYANIPTPSLGVKANESATATHQQAIHLKPKNIRQMNCRSNEHEAK